MDMFKSDVTLETLLQLAPVVVVDIFTEWCVPCRMMNPILEALEKEMEGVVKFCKVNVTEGAPRWLLDMNIKNVPSILYIRKGKIEEIESGLRNRDQILSKIEEVMTKVEEIT